MKISKKLILLLSCILMFSFALSPSAYAASVYTEFFGIFEKGPAMPLYSDSNSEWVPQGLAYVKEKNWILISYYWYTSNQKASTIAVVDAATRQYVKQVYLYESTSNPQMGHVGGLAVSQNNLWVASEESGNSYNLLQVKLDDLINTPDQGKLIAAKRYSLSHDASYASYYNGVLWVGDYTHGSSGLCSPTSGGKVYGYTLNSSDELSSTSPSQTWNTPDRIQGMAMTADRVIYSQSCGRTNDSKLITYTKGTNGTQVDSMVAPPMSEGLAIINNSLYVSFESGAKPYLSGGKYPLYHLYYSPLGSFINRVTGVVNTSGINLNVRSGPGTSYSIVDQVADGTKVTIRCQIKGETVTGTYGTSNLWDQIGEGKYVSDTYVYTGSDGQVAPTCAP